MKQDPVASEPLTLHHEPKRHVRFPLVLFAILLVLDTGLDLSQRKATNDVNFTGIQYYLHLVLDPWFVFSMVVPIFQLMTWTKILSKVELSLASPLTSLNFPLTVWTSHLIFNEAVDWKVWGGTALITAGVALLAHSEAKAEQSSPGASHA